MRKLSKEEFVARVKADLTAQRQARVDADGAYCRYVVDKNSKYLRRKKKYLMDK